MPEGSEPDDEQLGMDRRIDRRDFLNGVGVAIGALGLGMAGRAAADPPSPQDSPGYYPPLLTGMRGSHPGSFEAAHSLRDGDFWSDAAGLRDTGEDYDLIVVGGGISGLSAAWFYRADHPRARILVVVVQDEDAGAPSATSSG
jgi:spermidine dehydrogenase